MVLGLGGDRPEQSSRRSVPVVPIAAKAAPVGAPEAATAVPPSTKVGVSAAVPPIRGVADTVPDTEDFVPALKRRLTGWVEDFAKPEQRNVMLAIAFLTVMLVYSYLPALSMASVAWANPQYAHGWIVPLFSIALLFWWRRPAVVPVSLSARLVGLAVLLASFALRLSAAKFRIVTIDMYTFVPALVGGFLMAGGWSTLRWAWAPLLFLIFMFPLPDEATRYLLGPLQRIATMVSTFALQTLGLEAYREGNQIILGEMHLGVVDACSGLRMLTIFCALAVGLVMVGKRSWWENAVILASAIPIALAVNSIRITVTGLLFQVADSEFAERVFHDWAGLLMMPMAIGMLYVEQLVLSSIFLPESEITGVVSAKPQEVSGVRPVRGRSATKASGGGLGVVGIGGASVRRGEAPRSKRDNGTGGPIVGLPPRQK